VVKVVLLRTGIITVVAAAGCSAAPAGPPAELPHVPAAPRDAAVAVAPTPAAPPDAADDDDASFLANWHYTFEWQKRRDEYTALHSGSGHADECDAKYLYQQTTVYCPGPHEMAGFAIQASGGREIGTAIVNIDRGSKDLITTDWTVALLDDDGTPVTPWVPLTRVVDEHQSKVEIATTVFFAQHHRHVGMRIDQQLLDRIRRNEHHPPGDNRQ
jgi:hypothetical protein